MKKKNPFPPTKGHAKAAGTGHGPIGRKAGSGARRRGRIGARLGMLNAQGSVQVGG